MKPTLCTLPATPDHWDAWEQSYQAEREIDTCTHESGYGPSPMQKQNEDFIAFETAWDAFVFECAEHLRHLPGMLLVAIALIGFFWLLGAFGGPGQ